MLNSEIFSAIKASAAGMQTQGVRIRTISQNIANSNTTGTAPGADPYVRKTVSFKNALDRELGITVPQVHKINQDSDVEFPIEYQPDHPAADADGYVKLPNIKTLVEMMDIKEAQRSYEANLGMIEQSRNLVMRTIELLRV